MDKNKGFKVKGKGHGAPPAPPHKEISHILNCPEHEIKCCMPYTLSNGKKVEGFAVVTHDKTVKIENKQVVFQYPNQDIESFEFDDGFGCAMFNLVTKNGEHITICRADMKFRDMYMSSVSQFTMEATGHEAAFNASKTVFSRKGFFGGFSGPKGGPGGPPHDGPMGKGRPGGNKGGKKEQSDKNSAPVGRACPKCGRPYRPGTNKCMRCDRSKGYLKWMWSMVKPYTWGIILAVVLFFAVTAVNLIPPILNREMVDNYIKNTSGNVEIKGFIAVLLSLLALSILTRLITMLRSLLMNSIGTRVIVKIRQTVFDKIQKLSVSGINRMTAGELIQRVTQDSTVIKDFITGDFAEMIEQLLTFAGVAFMLFYYDWKLALIIMIPTPLVMLFWRLFSKKIHRLYHRQWQMNAASRSILQDIFSGIRVVKSYGSEQQEIKKYDSVTSDEKDIQIRNEVFFGRISPFLNFFMGFGEFFLLFYTCNKVLGGDMTFGDMSLFSSYASMIYGPLRWMSHLPRRILRVSNSISKIYDVIEDEDMLKKGKELDCDIEGDIVFENVGFGYERGNNVLGSVSLHIKKGEMIGLVGRSGVGKSTLINLVMRMYDVDRGRILIDGNDIKDISEQALRSRMGVVLQETFLFSGTVYDNIAYAKPDASREEVINAAKAAGAHKFIIKMQDGYNTYVGEHGYTMSGGERQRIAIARALLRDPAILILDEATSALDTETEKEIQDALQILSKNRTTIAIAHRLSTLRNCDRIIVLDKGDVAEEGSHLELMNKKGIYYGLVLAQRQMFTPVGNDSSANT